MALWLRSPNSFPNTWKNFREREQVASFDFYCYLSNRSRRSFMSPEFLTDHVLRTCFHFVKPNGHPSFWLGKFGWNVSQMEQYKHQSLNNIK